jgi:tetratricopeptide (TPR) repeat protein
LKLKPLILTFLLCAATSTFAKDKILPAPPAGTRKPLSERKQVERYYYFDEGKKRLIYGDYNAAIYCFERTVKADPHCDAAYYELAKIYAAAAHFDAALTYAQYAYKLDTANVWFALLLAELYANTDQFREAKSLLEHAYAAHPSNMDALQILMDVYDRLHDYDKAIALLTALQKRSGDSEPNMVAKQTFLFKQGKMLDAINETKRLIEAFPDEQRHYLSLAEIYGVLRNDTLSFYALMQARQLDSASFEFLAGLAEFYRRTADFNSYFKVQRLLFADKETPLLYKLQSLDVLQNLPKVILSYSQHIDTLFTLAEQNARSCRLWLLHTRFLLLTKNYDKAYALLKEMVLYAKSDLKLRDVAFSKQSSPYFSSLAGDAIALHDGWQIYFDFIMEHKEWDSLLYEAEAFAKVFNDWSQAHYLQGQAHLQKKDYEQARQALTAAEELLEPDDTVFAERIYLLLGEVCFAQKDHSMSDKYFEKAIKLNPENLMTLNNYAYFLSLSNRKLKRALTMSKKTIDAEPDNATYLDTYAWILYQLGRYSDAKQIFHRAIARGGDKEPVMLEHYGDVLYKLNESGTAQIYWQRALENGGDSPELQRKLMLVK